MNKFSRALFTGLLLAAIGGGTALADNLQDGKAAFQKEQYTQALELLTPYAKQGNAEAAFLLGEMYGPRSWGQQGENRNGVEQDNKQAIYWWTEAAKAGHAEAQLKLGWWLMYGKGVVEVDQKEVATPSDVQAQIAAARKANQRVVTFLIYRQGDFQWVALRIDQG